MLNTFQSKNNPEHSGVKSSDIIGGKTKIIFILTTIFITMIIYGCATSSLITDKIGAQLWGENCNRCHNTPSPTDFSDGEWETIGTHMKIRANLTDDETKKIVEFLQSAN